MWSIDSTDLEFEFNGYQYRTYLEVEDDNQKLFHFCYLNGQYVQMEPSFYNHTPYERMTRDEFMCHLHMAGLYGNT